MNQHLAILRERAREGRSSYQYQDNSPASIVAYAREHTREAIDYFVSVLRDPNAETKDRQRAGRELLDRGIGKPRQIVEVNGEFGVNVTQVQSGMRGLRESVLAAKERRRERNFTIDLQAMEVKEGDNDGR